MSWHQACGAAWCAATEAALGVADAGLDPDPPMRHRHLDPWLALVGCQQAHQAPGGIVAFLPAETSPDSSSSTPSIAGCNPAGQGVLTYPRNRDSSSQPRKMLRSLTWREWTTGEVGP